MQESMADFLNWLNFPAAVTLVLESRPIMTSNDLLQHHHHQGKV